MLSKGIQARIAAIVASFVIATLASHGIGDLSQDVRGEIEQWVSHTFDLILFLGYAILHPWIQRKLASLDAGAPLRSGPHQRLSADGADQIRDQK